MAVRVHRPMRQRSRLASALRLPALATASGVLLGAACPELAPYDKATFGAVTSCGPSGAVTLSTEEKDSAWGCGRQRYDLVHADGGGGVGLPELGEIDFSDLENHPRSGDLLLDSRIVLLGPVTIPGSTPPRTIERRCTLARSAPDVLGVGCEGPDPAAACTGTLTRRSTP